MSEFDDIRPYKDDEVRDVIKRVIADKELIDIILTARLPTCAKVCPWLLRPVVRWKLRSATYSIKTIKEFQAYFTGILLDLLDNSTDGYSFSGLDNLEPDKTYLFISNHRDIALDPLLIGLALKDGGMESARIAIGDNLVEKSYAEDLMRLNDCFIVKRSVTGRRQKLEALKTLSRYMRQSVVNEKVPVWIAQKEGRSKDGNDQTETALLKMLALSGAKEAGFVGAIDELNLVPVAISYEYDPCEADKGRELYIKGRGEDYVKSENEDIDSIYKGFFGYKGRIHLEFGLPISGHEDADSLAEEIDRQIHSNYRLFPSNIIAYQIESHGEGLDKLKQQWPDEDWEMAEHRFRARLQQISAAHRDVVVSAYARPVINQLKAKQAS